MESLDIQYSIVYSILTASASNSLNERGQGMKIEGMDPVDYRPLGQKVYEKLKLSILNGDVPAGAHLTETQTAQQMGTSATPVREAFRLLAAEGLVRIEPWKGAVVAQYSSDEIREVFECRAVLEQLALDLTLTNLAARPDREEATARVGALIERSKAEDAITRFVSINSEIHDFWIAGSNNKRLLRLMDDLNDVLLHDRNVSARDDKRRGEIIKEHTDILAAIRQQDKRKARSALARHIKNGYAYSANLRKE